MLVVMIMLLALKISCEQIVSAKTNFTISSKFLKLLTAPKLYSSTNKQQIQELIEHQTDAYLPINDDDLEFPLEKCNQILLDNKDAAIIDQHKGIKRFVQERSREKVLVYCNKESSIGLDKKQRGKTQNSVVKFHTSIRNQKQELTKRKTMEFPNSHQASENKYHKLKSLSNCNRKVNSPLHKRDIATGLKDKSIAYRNLDRMDVLEYIPGNNIVPNINNDKKHEKSSNEPPIYSDDYAHDTNFNEIKSFNENITNTYNSQTILSTQKAITDIITGSLLLNLVLPQDQTTKLIQNVTSNVTVTPSIHKDINNANVTKGVATNKDTSKNYVLSQEGTFNAGTLLTSTQQMFTTLKTPLNITRLVKGGTTEDYCLSFSGKLFLPHGTVDLKGIPQTTNSISGFDVIVQKINKTIHIGKKTNESTKSPIIKLAHHEQAQTQNVSVIKKILGITPKQIDTTSTRRPFFITDECVTVELKGNKVHPFRHKGGDPGNHYLHGKPKLFLTLATINSTEVHPIIHPTHSIESTSTHLLATSIPNYTEEPFIPRFKGGTHSKQFVNTSNICTLNGNNLNDIKELLPQKSNFKLKT